MSTRPGSGGLGVQPEIAGTKVKPRSICKSPRRKGAQWTATLLNQKQFAN